jgi:hypothetical protein
MGVPYTDEVRYRYEEAVGGRGGGEREGKERGGVIFLNFLHSQELEGLTMR